MTADGNIQAYLSKAEESLASAGADYASGRYNSCANRCYYACYQAAVAALMLAGVLRSAAGIRPEHSFVQAQFSGQLVVRRKVYEPALRSVLGELMTLRLIADYRPGRVSQAQAERALRRARRFVYAVTSNRGVR